MQESDQHQKGRDRVYRRILTTQGIFFEGRRYHDPAMTTALLDAALAVSQHRNRVRQRFEVIVEVARGERRGSPQGVDRSYIKVRSPGSNEEFVLPNVWGERLLDIQSSEQLRDVLYPIAAKVVPKTA